MAEQLAAPHRRHLRQIIQAVVCAVWIGLNFGASACAEIKSVSGRAFGTSYTLKLNHVGKLNHDGSHLSVDSVASMVADELERIESIFSLYRTDSELSRLNQCDAGLWVPVSQDLFSVLQFAVQLADQTAGALDPTVRPLMEAWDMHRASIDWSPPSSEAIREAQNFVGIGYIELQDETRSLRKNLDSVRLDLNALVEGWAIDQVLKLLRQAGAHNALFEIGGEFGGVGESSNGQAWTIGIEDPRDVRRLFAKVALDNSSLCTSGTYRQARMHDGKSYSHIIDPRTGHPLDHELTAVSVVHASAMVADGWATALMVLGPEQGPSIANKNQLAASFVKRDPAAHIKLTARAGGIFDLQLVQRVSTPHDRPSPMFRPLWIVPVAMAILFVFAVTKKWASATRQP